MKKVISLLSLLLFAIFLVSCTRPVTELDAPVIKLSDTTISWEGIENAEGYLVNVNTKSKETTETSFNLNEFNLADGLYSVTVVAHANDQKVLSSKSNVISYRVGEEPITDEKLEKLRNDILRLIDDSYQTDMTTNDFSSTLEYEQYLIFVSFVDVYIESTNKFNLNINDRLAYISITKNLINNDQSIEQLLLYIDELVTHNLNVDIAAEIVYELGINMLRFYSDELGVGEEKVATLAFVDELETNKDEYISALADIFNFGYELRKTLSPAILNDIKTLITANVIPYEIIIKIKDSLIDNIIINLPSEETFTTVINLVAMISSLNYDDQFNSFTEISLELVQESAKAMRESILIALKVIKEITLEEVLELLDYIDKLESGNDSATLDLVNFIISKIITYADAIDLDLNKVMTLEEFTNLVNTLISLLEEQETNEEMILFLETYIEQIYNIYAAIGSKTTVLLQSELIPMFLLVGINTDEIDKDILFSTIFDLYLDLEITNELVDDIVDIMQFFITVSFESSEFREIVISVNQIATKVATLYEDGSFEASKDKYGQYGDAVSDAFVFINLAEDFFAVTDNLELVIDLLVSVENFKKELDGNYNPKTRSEITNEINLIVNDINTYANYENDQLTDEILRKIERFAIENLPFDYEPQFNEHIVIKVEYDERNGFEREIELGYDEYTFEYTATEDQLVVLATNYGGYIDASHSGEYSSGYYGYQIIYSLKKDEVLSFQIGSDYKGAANFGFSFINNNFEYDLENTNYIERLIYFPDGFEFKINVTETATYYLYFTENVTIKSDEEYISNGQFHIIELFAEENYYITPDAYDLKVRFKMSHIEENIVTTVNIVDGYGVYSMNSDDLIVLKLNIEKQRTYTLGISDEMYMFSWSSYAKNNEPEILNYTLFHGDSFNPNIENNNYIYLSYSHYNDNYERTIYIEFYDK